jgi:hypothetical protein
MQDDLLVPRHRTIRCVIRIRGNRYDSHLEEPSHIVASRSHLSRNFIEVQCEDCNGTGYDFGSHKDFDPEYCPRCGGSGIELVFRNYLAEAFRIVSDPQCKVALCREQIVALAIYARQTVSALFGSEPTSTTAGVEQTCEGGVRW